MEFRIAATFSTQTHRPERALLGRHAAKAAREDGGTQRRRPLMKVFSV